MADRRIDEGFLRAALREARRGVGRTHPNPPVGAVVVRNGRIVGRGYHRRAGAAHGEAMALERAGRAARGATLYVTLEPCNHHGRTPPCTAAVLAAGIRRVVIGSIDPNPHVAGSGRHALESAGVTVACGVLQAECDALLAPFRKHITTGLPWVTLKLAASLDGRIATADGDSRWITGEASRQFVHRLRDEHDAILVGAETVRRDDPQLTCRRRGGRNPLRVVVAGRLDLPLDAHVVRDSRAIPTLVLTAHKAPAKAIAALQDAGVEVVRCPARGGRIAMREVLDVLGRRGLSSVLVEGGASVASQLLRARLVDELLLFLAPKLIGGDGRPVLDSLAVRRMSDALATGPLRLRRFAGDLLVATQLRSAPPETQGSKPDEPTPD